MGVRINLGIQLLVRARGFVYKGLQTTQRTCPNVPSRAEPGRKNRAETCRNVPRNVPKRAEPGRPKHTRRSQDDVGCKDPIENVLKRTMQSSLDSRAQEFSHGPT